MASMAHLVNQPALPSPELELHPASPFPSLLTPMLSLVLLPIFKTALPPHMWFAAPSYRM